MFKQLRELLRVRKYLRQNNLHRHVEVRLGSNGKVIVVLTDPKIPPTAYRQLSSFADEAQDKLVFTLTKRVTDYWDMQFGRPVHIAMYSEYHRAPIKYGQLFLQYEPHTDTLPADKFTLSIGKLSDEVTRSLPQPLDILASQTFNQVLTSHQMATAAAHLYLRGGDLPCNFTDFE